VMYDTGNDAVPSPMKTWRGDRNRSNNGKRSERGGMYTFSEKLGGIGLRIAIPLDAICERKVT